MDTLSLNGAWLELTGADADGSTNFVHLCPGQPVEISVTPKSKLTAKAFKEQLSVKRLINTY